MPTDDFAQHDDEDRRRLADLRHARAAGDAERVRELLGELIAGWRPIGEGWLVVRAGRETAEEVLSRLETRLVGLLLRKQEFDQAWGQVYWSNLKWILADVRGEHAKQADRQTALDDVAFAVADPDVEPEREALDDRLSVDVGRLHRALATLSEADRELLRLVYWEDVGPEQLAQRLGAARGTIAVRKHRAVDRLTDAFFRPDVIDPPAPGV